MIRSIVHRLLVTINRITNINWKVSIKLPTMPTTSIHRAMFTSASGWANILGSAMKHLNAHHGNIFSYIRDSRCAGGSRNECKASFNGFLLLLLAKAPPSSLATIIVIMFICRFPSSSCMIMSKAIISYTSIVFKIHPENQSLRNMWNRPQPLLLPCMKFPLSYQMNGPETYLT